MKDKVPQICIQFSEVKILNGCLFYKNQVIRFLYFVLYFQLLQENPLTVQTV